MTMARNEEIRQEALKWKSGLNNLRKSSRMLKAQLEVELRYMNGIKLISYGYES